MKSNKNISVKKGSGSIKMKKRKYLKRHSNHISNSLKFKKVFHGGDLNLDDYENIKFSEVEDDLLFFASVILSSESTNYEILNLDKDKMNRLTVDNTIDRDDKEGIVNKAYKKMARLYHSDKLKPDVKEKCNTDECFKKIGNAKDYILNLIDKYYQKKEREQQLQPQQQQQQEQQQQEQQQQSRFSSFKSNVSKAFSNAKQAAANVGTSAKNKTVRAFNTAKQAAANVGTSAKNKTVRAFNTAKQSLSEKAKKYKNYIKDKLNKNRTNDSEIPETQEQNINMDMNIREMNKEEIVEEEKNQENTIKDKSNEISVFVNDKSKGSFTENSVLFIQSINELMEQINITLKIINGKDYKSDEYKKETAISP
jgi:hypothetical protein